MHYPSPPPPPTPTSALNRSPAPRTGCRAAGRTLPDARRQPRGSPKQVLSPPSCCVPAPCPVPPRPIPSRLSSLCSVALRPIQIPICPILSRPIQSLPFRLFSVLSNISPRILSLKFVLSDPVPLCSVSDCPFLVLLIRSRHVFVFSPTLLISPCRVQSLPIPKTGAPEANTNGGRKQQRLNRAPLSRPTKPD